MRAVWLLCAVVAVAQALPLQPIVWPGLAVQPSFNSYSGYVNVGPHNRSLFFMFSESQRNPARDPVVLWLTGGPGCSSLLAFLSENGPFRPSPDDPTRLILDQYAWNRRANVIWLESPAGVGFSFSNDPNDYITGDARTANDTDTFLRYFFGTLFPQYRANPLYITGESYGGHYVPTASERVLLGNARSSVKINLVGLLEGNAWTAMPLDNLGAVDTWQQRMIASADQVAAVKASCNLSYVGPLRGMRSSDACDDAINAAMANFNYVNIYDIYVDVCESSNANKHLHQLAKVSWLHGKMARAMQRSNPPLPPFDPCSDNHLSTYLNLLEVQKAINAVPASATQPVQWTECSNTVQYNFNDVATSVVPVLQRLMDRPDFHVLVYSGDVDAIVPTQGTLNWIATLKQRVVQPWRVWLDENGQAGGFVTVYEKFTFTTVRGAGHMVPQYQPARMYQVFDSWLSTHSIK